MLLSEALVIYSNNRISEMRESAFWVIAQYMADEEANRERMSKVERDQLFSDYRDDIENLYYKARENMLG